MQSHGGEFITRETIELRSVRERLFEQPDAHFQPQNPTNGIIDASFGNQPFLDQFTEIDAEIPVQRDHGHIDPGIYSDPNRILAALGDMIPLI